MSSTIERTTVVRRKSHKGGKVMSLGIIGAAVALVVVLAVSQTVSTKFHSVQNQFDRDVVAVTDVTAGDKLQPMSAKIVASDSASMIVSDETISIADYVDVWAKLERLSPESATEAERMKTIEVFLSGLNYKSFEKGGIIVSIATGDPISPETLACYLNGYIAEKPYLKTNCPAF